MKILQKYKDKRKQKAVRKLRQQSTAQKGATTWNEQQQRSSNQRNLLNPNTKAWIKKDGWALAGILIIVLGFGGYYFFNKMTVTAVEVSQTSFIDNAAVKKDIESHIHSKLLGFIPRDAYFLVSEEKIAQRIHSSFGQNYALEGVSVTKTYPNTLSITITERIPSLVWVTNSADREEGEPKIYTVDQNGIVTQQLGKIEDANPGYPKVKDKNREELGIGWHIISPEYIAFVMELSSTFGDTTEMEVEEFILPRIDCHKQEYVAEEVFNKAMEKEDTEEIKKQKREIQERFQNGEITIDESIALLEQVEESKTTETDDENEETDETASEDDEKEKDDKNDVERIEWETVDIPVDCDLVTVAQDVYVKAKAPGSKSSFIVYFDVTQPMETQLQHVVTILRTKVEDPSTLKYIDVRIPDRVYYK